MYSHSATTIILGQSIYARQTDMHKHVDGGRLHASHRLAREAVQTGLAPRRCLYIIRILSILC